MILEFYSLLCSAGKSAIPSQAMLKKTEVNIGHIAVQYLIVFELGRWESYL